MSGIAQLLLAQGRQVSGSDVKDSAMTRQLRQKGARVFIGHEAGNVAGADVVVYSSAVKEDNPEMRAAAGSGIRIIKRAEALAELMQEKTVITVAGSHGKTTTTSLASSLLIEAGLSPTVAIGGIFRNIGQNALNGTGEYFVAEADESDGSFLCFDPAYSIITNIDREHLDYYGTFQRQVEAFESFLQKTKRSGCLFWCADDPVLDALAARYTGRKSSFGLGHAAELHAENIVFQGLRSEFDCSYRSSPLGRFTLALGGMHNISNALSVIALGKELGIAIETIRNVLANYKGAGRRLELKFEDRGVSLFDDYAHHPTEIRATLSALANLSYKRLIAVFQPHRYSRTRALMEEFTGCFNGADRLIVTDIYPASEPPIPGVTAQLLTEKIQGRGGVKAVEYQPKEAVLAHIMGIRQPGDVIVMLGAGDITRISDALAEEFAKHD
jgi:UDP-N-acetylmuramate--alanine ligase